MTNLIFSPENGFYQEHGQWVDDPADATEYDPAKLPNVVAHITGKDDARLINPKLYSNETFDEIVDRFIESLGEELDGSMVASQASNILEETVSYEEDSVWLFKGETLSWSTLSLSIEEALHGMDRESLKDHYNEYCENQVFLDHNEGFIHQQVL